MDAGAAFAGQAALGQGRMTTRLAAVPAAGHRIHIEGGTVFTKTSRADKAREQAGDVASAVAETWHGKVAPTARHKARDARKWAAPHVEHGRKAAAPKIEAAVEKVSPAVDAARDKLDDWMPRVLEAAATAGAAAGAAAGEYRSRTGDAVAVLKGEAAIKPKRRRVLRKLMLVPLVAAAAGAAYAAFKARAPKDDPWAVPTGTYPAYTPPASVATTAPPAAASSASADLSTSSAVDGLDAASEPTDKP